MSLENPLNSNHVAPPRNEAAFQFVDEKLKGWNRLKTLLTILGFFVALGYTEVTGVFQFTDQTVSCCSSFNTSSFKPPPPPPPPKSPPPNHHGSVHLRLTDTDGH